MVMEVWTQEMGVLPLRFSCCCSFCIFIFCSLFWVSSSLSFPPCSFVSSVSLRRNQGNESLPFLFLQSLSVLPSYFLPLSVPWFCHPSIYPLSCFLLLWFYPPLECHAVDRALCFNAGVKVAIFFFSSEEDEQCWSYFTFWSLMFWKFCNQALG